VQRALKIIRSPYLFVSGEGGGGIYFIINIFRKKFPLSNDATIEIFPQLDLTAKKNMREEGRDKRSRDLSLIYIFKSDLYRNQNILSGIDSRLLRDCVAVRFDRGF